MPRHRETITVELPADEARLAWRRILPSLGWEAHEEGPDRLLAAEDPTRLDCHTSPSSLEIGMSPRAAGRTEVSLDLTAPGIGPIPGPARLIRQAQALKSRIDAECRSEAR